MRTIRLFMWGYQDMFNISAQVAAEQIFKKLDPNLKPTTFLVGVLYEERENSYPICLEPEDECDYTPEMFSSIKELAKQLQSVDEGNYLFHSHPVAQERHEKALELKTIRDAIIRVIESRHAITNVVSFCSWPVLVQGYLVCVILQFPRKEFESHYSLVKNSNGRFNIPVSLLDATISEYLSNCSKTLIEPDPGAGLNVIGRNYEEIIRSAGKTLMYTPASAGDAFEGLHGLFDSCNSISSLRYEGVEGTGKMLIARKGHPNIKMSLSLRLPVSVNNFRAVRKLLELSTDEYCLVSDSAVIYGLGKIIDNYNPRYEDLFAIRFTRHYAWELSHANNLMMRVNYGQPSLPTGKLDQQKFKTDLKRIFIDIEENSIEDLWRLTIESSKQKHGTMLVISGGAKEENERLIKQSTSISPTKMTPEILKLVSTIDGAVLIGPDSTCYAIGVILDGLATEKGDSSRGARYNSAIRYIESSKYPCLIIVVSEDGMINLLPDLRPQIRRSDIVEMISTLRSISQSDSVNFKQFNKTMGKLIKHKFYCLPEQCEEINSLRAEIEKKMGATNVRIVYEDFIPHSEMNESYFLSSSKA